PAELMQLQNMQLMSISNNDIKGPLPSEIGVLSGMAVLEASNASLNGTVPTELENLSGLTVLNLANNPFLSGSIPAGLCGIQALNFDCSKVLCGCNCSCTNT
ncbi:Di-glucose binding within endoplasmic reticulum (Partial), partial [Seminavis robusta]